MSLTAEQIRERAKCRRSKVVPIPEWNDEVHVFALMADAADRLAELNYETDPEEAGKLRFKRAGHTARLVVFHACDANGQRLFTGADLAEVGTWDHLVLQRIVNAVRELGSLGDDSGEAEAKN